MILALQNLRDWLTVPAPQDGEQGENEEIERASRHSRRFVLTTFVVMAALALIPVEGAVIASGEVSVDSRVKTITHPMGGVLSQVLVREGQRVAAGEALIVLDSSVLGPSAHNAALSRDQLIALSARLEAERDDRPAIAFPDELAMRRDANGLAAIERERRQFELGRAERANTLALLRQRIRQFQEQINSYRVQIKATRRQLELIQPELEGLRSLKERGLVTINRLNEMERTAVQLSATEASLEADIAQAEARISETQEQILNVSQTRRVQAGTDLATTIAQLADQDSRAISTEDTLQRATIMAPQAGVVDQIAYATVGSAIPPNEPIVRLVPDEDKLIVSARVSPADVDALSIDQLARVRFSTLDRRLSPEIDGRLAFISAERTDDPSGSSYYRVRVEVDESELTEAGGRNLRAGQPVEVFFTTGSRSILIYALKPLLDQIRKAMRE